MCKRDMTTGARICYECGEEFTPSDFRAVVCDDCMDKMFAEAANVGVNTMPADGDTKPVTPLQFFTDTDGSIHIMPPGPEEL